MLQRNNIHIKVCPEGEVTATLAALRQSAATARHKAKFILATDGKTFEAENLGNESLGGETVACAYADFHDHFGFFLPLAGITTVKQIRENAFDIKATGRLNRLYIELLKENPDWDTAARREDLNHFFARLIFCFFAEDTGIFMGGGLFTDTIEQMSARDSSNTHEVLSEMFRAMDTKAEERDSADLRNWAKSFPYVNGGLFSGSMEVPRFSRSARSYLIHVGRLDWKKINPDIFGSMIQAVADDEERGALGMHYTSVPNILKVLNPLFLDDLRAKLEEAGDGNSGGARKLLNLRQRIARIRVFDPACGSRQFPGHRLQGNARDRSGDQPPPRRGRPPYRHPAHQLPRHRAAAFLRRDRPAGADHRRVPVRCALSRPKARPGRIPAAGRRQLDHLRQRPPARLAEHLPADRNWREAPCQ